jgi:hypothetical protein
MEIGAKGTKLRSESAGSILATSALRGKCGYQPSSEFLGSRCNAGGYDRSESGEYCSNCINVAHFLRITSSTWHRRRLNRRIRLVR